jgi:hypothetical protein
MKRVPGGFAIIISTVAASALGALFFPVAENDAKEETAQ